jgi:hypothetical protein
MNEHRVQAALTDLGFEAAEMRTVAGQLAQACTRGDLIEVCTLARVLEQYCGGFGMAFGKLLKLTGDEARYGSPAGAMNESVSL